MLPEANTYANGVGRHEVVDGAEHNITPSNPNRKSPNRQALIGRLLVLWGLLAWISYSILWIIQQAKPPTAPFLAWHLSGVLSAAFLKVINFLREKPAASESAETLMTTKTNTGDKQA